jgi:hypothetical protein
MHRDLNFGSEIFLRFFSFEMQWPLFPHKGQRHTSRFRRPFRKYVTVPQILALVRTVRATQIRFHPLSKLRSVRTL